MDGFTHLFDDPQIMRSAIEKEGYTEVEHGDRVLQLLASTIQNQESKIIGSAALIRDVTAEKHMQAELRHLATSDSLTGLYNRRYLDDMLAKELERCQRYKHELSIMMFDVDHFKRFNDEHGHDQGDRVLQSMGKVVKNLMRTLDVPCRYGGEEFLVILPETNIEGAMSIAERARKTVANTEVDGLSVTISIGVASYPHSLIENVQQFIEAADKALYKAKSDGRNCVRLAT